MDLQLIEQGNGGEILKKAKDLSVIEGLQNMPYLALFGGNTEMNSSNKRLVTEQDFSFWGNNLFFPNDQGVQFNSNTERTLNNTALTSAGRAIIEQAVKEDLKFMKDFCRVAIAVSIVATDKIVIGIQLHEPDNIQRRDFIFIWDATRSELDLQEGTASSPSTGVNAFFDYFLDFDFI